MDGSGRYIGILILDIGFKRPDYASMSLSRQHPLAEQRHIDFLLFHCVLPQAETLMACTLLRPLYTTDTTLCISSGLQIGHAVQSVKPQ